jgi:hypothetical protein
MKKVQMNDFFVFEYTQDIQPLNKYKIMPLSEIKNSNNNPSSKDTYNYKTYSRNYYGKKRRYYTDYI